MRGNTKGQKCELLTALRNGQLRIGLVQLDCVESLICGLAASNAVTYKRADEHIKTLHLLRVGRRSVSQNSSDDEIMSWYKKIEEITNIVNNDIAQVKRNSALS